MPKCRTCPAEIMWAKNKESNKANPLDAHPSSDGNLLVVFGPEGAVYEVLKKDDLKRARAEGRQLYISHFATCPNSQAHRKARTVKLPEEVLAQADTREAAEELAKALRDRFHCPIYVPPGDTGPFNVWTDEEVSELRRRDINTFIAQYATQKEVNRVEPPATAASIQPGLLSMDTAR